VLALGAQGGLLLALPVVAGLALGYWLDRQLALAFPWITLALTLVGAILGPVMLYRWVMSTVSERVQRRLEVREKDEEKAEDGEFQESA
jgi:F0F1-type ATP synthase assembly protein I